MKYNRFEELPVWKDAANLAVELFRFSSKSVFRGKGDLANQIQRAGLSISNNIAEGFERGTTQELITFLYYARGSAGEVRSMLAIVERMPEFEALQPTIQGLKGAAESIARQIRGWAQALQDGTVRGQRYLTAQVREEQEKERSRLAFEKEIDRLSKESRGF